jgi:elongation factor G
MDVDFLRNVGIVAHIDAGKTTTTERILYYTGKTHKIGEVHEGTATMDWMEQEQERGITITSAATHCAWNRHQKKYAINIIDTPGHIDFGIEVERSLRVLDGVVVVLCSVAGVQPQTETVWRQTQKFSIPKIIFLNKLDRIGADFSAAVEQVKEKFQVSPICLNIPIKIEEKLIAIIDLLKMKAVFFDEDSLGSVFEEKPIPDAYIADARKKRQELLEQLSLIDDFILEKLLETKEQDDIDEQHIRGVIRKGVLSQQFIPVFCGSAFKNIGVQLLLDGIVDFLPSPKDIDYKQKGVGEGNSLQPDSSLPFVSLIFKTEKNKFAGIFSFLRIYQGQLEKGKIYYLNKEKKERIDNIYRVHAVKKESIDKAGAGEIVAVSLNNASTGYTLAQKGFPFVLEEIKKFQPVVSVAIEPHSLEDLQKLKKILEFLEIEDPSFQFRLDSETGQIVISGMGELHLEVIREKILRDYKLKIVSGNPQVSYRESIGQAAEESVEIQKTVAKENLYAKCKIRLEPLQNSEVVFEQKIDFEHPQKEEILAEIKKAVQKSALSGVVGGYPIINLKAILIGIEVPSGKLNASTYAVCISQAFRSCLQKANSFLLSPMMNLQVICPEDCLGEIIRDLNSRKAKISVIQEKNKERIITANIFLTFLFGYTTIIRSLSKGRAYYSAEFAYYSKDEQKLKELSSST